MVREIKCLGGMRWSLKKRNFALIIIIYTFSLIQIVINSLKYVINRISSSHISLKNALVYHGRQYEPVWGYLLWKVEYKNILCSVFGFSFYFWLPVIKLAFLPFEVDSIVLPE